MRHVGSGTRERFPRRVSTTFRQFKAPFSPSPVLHPRRRSTAYLIKAYWSRYAYNRINCFWCESTRDLAMLSALWKVSHSSLRLSSTYCIYISPFKPLLKHSSPSLPRYAISSREKQNTIATTRIRESMNSIRNDTRRKIRNEILQNRFLSRARYIFLFFNRTRSIVILRRIIEECIRYF